MNMINCEPASDGETLPLSSDSDNQLIDVKQEWETEHEVDLAKVTANVNIDTGPLTRVQEDELVADKQYLDPIAFIEIKAEVEHSMIAIKLEPDSDKKILPVSSANNSQLVHVKQEEHSAFPNLDWETEHSLNTVKVMAHSKTNSDPVTGVCEDKLVDNKQLLDPIAFVAVKAEVTSEDQLVDCDLHTDETRVSTNIQHNQSQSSRAVITARNKNNLNRKREAEKDTILKKTSTVLDKANNNDDLKVFGEFVASELRGLRNDSVRKKAKRNIQRILLDAGIEDDNVSMDLNSQSSSRTALH